MQNLGGVLQEERLKAGIKQADLARQACVSRQTLSGYETGAIPIPHDVACRIIHQLALQDKEFPFGVGIKVDKRWSYYINRERFRKYMTGEDMTPAESDCA